MLGAIIGDIVGSRFEWNNIKTKKFELFTENCHITDDSVMTLALAKAILESSDGSWKLQQDAVTWMQAIGRKYPDCGYGSAFAAWLFSDQPQPYNSFGNGAAMRVSAAGCAAASWDEAIELAVSTGAELLVPMHFDLYEVNRVSAACVAQCLEQSGGNLCYHIFRPGERFIFEK